MRRSISHLLGPHAQPPAGDELTTLHGLLRGHLHLLIPEVEQAALNRDREDVPRYVALACVDQARTTLRTAPCDGGYGALVQARRLARRLAALCDHYETLTGVAMCLACDQPLHNEDSLPYDHVSPSGPAIRVGRIHTHCTHRYRRH